MLFTMLKCYCDALNKTVEHKQSLLTYKTFLNMNKIIKGNHLTHVKLVFIFKLLKLFIGIHYFTTK